MSPRPHAQPFLPADPDTLAVYLVASTESPRPRWRTARSRAHRHRRPRRPLVR